MLKLRKGDNTMHRRDFCKVLGAVATAAVATNSWPKPLSVGAHEAANPGYAAFCALPESERLFSIVSGDRIVREKFDRGLETKLAATMLQRKLPWNSPIPGMEFP
jgi:hypothetical protein